MRIAHVVTYVSPDGAFGGPVRVALGQAAALAERGQDVTVFAASPGESPQSVQQDGYRLRTFPARRIARRLGFAGMYAPGLTNALKAELPGLDVVHVHLARDLVTLPTARATRKAGVRLIAQPHGMIDKSSNPLAAPVDAWEVRAALTQATAVLTLTDQEARDIHEIAPSACVRAIGNGIRMGDLPPYARRNGGVLFLARLHPRKRPKIFVEMAQELVSRGVELDFILAGPDEGEGEAVRALIESSGVSERISWIGPVEPGETDSLLRQARAFVLPAVGEIFPMAILEAFAAGTPVVTTSSLGIAAKCAEYGAAIITDGSVGALAAAVEEVISTDTRAENLRRGALKLLAAEMSMDVVVDTLLDVYGAAPKDRESR